MWSGSNLTIFIWFWSNLIELTLSNVSTNSVNHCCCCSCWLNMQKLHAKKNDFYPHHWGPFFRSCILNRRKYNIACIKYFDLTKGGLKSESRRMIFKLPKRVPKTILGLKKRKFSVFLHLQVESIFWFYK